MSAIAVWVWLAFRYHHRWLYTAPPLLWLVNVLVFYLAAFANAIHAISVSFVLLNIWSASLSMLAVVMVLGIGIVWIEWGTPYDDIY